MERGAQGTQGSPDPRAAASPNQVSPVPFEGFDPLWLTGCEEGPCEQGWVGVSWQEGEGAPSTEPPELV